MEIKGPFRGYTEYQPVLIPMDGLNRGEAVTPKVIHALNACLGKRARFNRSRLGDELYMKG
jgi:hypothetical protein